MRTGPRRSLCPPRDAASPSRLIPLPHFPTHPLPLPPKPNHPTVEKSRFTHTHTPTPRHTSRSAWKTQKPFPLYGRGVLFFLLREGRLRAKTGTAKPRIPTSGSRGHPPQITGNTTPHLHTRKAPFLPKAGHKRSWLPPLARSNRACTGVERREPTFLQSPGGFLRAKSGQAPHFAPPAKPGWGFIYEPCSLPRPLR